MNHIAKPNKVFHLHFEMEHYRCLSTHSARVELEPVIVQDRNSKGKRVLRESYRVVEPHDDDLSENMLFDKYLMQQRGRAFTEWDALHLFRDELPGICFDKISSGDQYEHFQELMTKLKKQDHAKYQETIKRAKEFPIEVLIQKFGYNPRMNKINCPFHEDPGASLHIYRKDNRWHCFGCQEHGDTIDFVQKQLNCEFKDAVEYLT